MCHPVKRINSYNLHFQCYIQYMKFCRRTEGTASARAIFKRAREDSRSTYHVFVAAALMEYYCTKVWYGFIPASEASCGMGYGG